MSIAFEQLRAEPMVHSMLDYCRLHRGEGSYDALMSAIYGGWMEDSVLMAGLLFSELMNRAGAPANLLTTPILEMMFSVARGSDDDYDSEEDWRKQRHVLVENWLEWSEEFLGWGRERSGEAPGFDWEGFMASLVKHGVIESFSTQRVNFEGAMQLIEGRARTLRHRSLEYVLREVMLKDKAIEDYRFLLRVVESIVTDRRFKSEKITPLQPFHDLSMEEKEILVPLVAMLSRALSDYYAREEDSIDDVDAVINLVLEYGGSFTPENLLSFATLVQEYNWEWATAAMEWRRSG